MQYKIPEVNIKWWRWILNENVFQHFLCINVFKKSVEEYSQHTICACNTGQKLFIDYYYLNRNVADRLNVILKYMNLRETTHLETL